MMVVHRCWLALSLHDSRAYTAFTSGAPGTLLLEQQVTTGCDCASMLLTRHVQARAVSASPSNPGIPPSSLMSMLRAAPAISGALLADFDSAFVNRSAGFVA